MDDNENELRDKARENAVAFLEAFANKLETSGAAENLRMPAEVFSKTLSAVYYLSMSDSKGDWLPCAEQVSRLRAIARRSVGWS